MSTVKDTKQAGQALKEQVALEKELSLEDNRAGDKELARRAKNVVAACIADERGQHAKMSNMWARLNSAYRLHSLSQNAQDYDVCLGSVFAKVEEFATKMTATIFNGRDIIGGTPLDRDFGKKAEAAVALVREQFADEYKLESDATEFFREAGRRGVEARETDDATIYDFGKLKETKLADTRYQAKTVLPDDFRIPLSAESVEEAAWCGDFSYPTIQDLMNGVTRGIYDEACVERLRQPETEEPGPAGAPHGNRWESGGDQGTRDAPDAGSHTEQFSCFEWWGDFDLEDNGELVPCVITLAMPASRNDTSDYSVFPSEGEVIRVTRNPYFHQRKPYVGYRPLPRKHDFYSMGIAEVVGPNSKYEDDLATMSLMGAMWEMSPPLEIGQAAGVLEEELDGFFPGKTYTAEVVGQVGFVAPPARSGIGFQTAEFLNNKSEQNMGLGSPSSAPRTPAAGVMTDSQQIDLRQMAWVTAYEQQVLIPLAELTHGYNGQFMTRERKVRVLGMKGVHAEDITTVNPTDLAVDVRFEPVVGKALIQRASQIQGLVNLFDRMGSMMNLQMGKPERYDLSKVLEIVMRDGFQVRDTSFINSTLDTSELPTPQEEHTGFRSGERPEVHPNENMLQHAMAHMTFLEEGGAADWDPQDRQAFVDHISETIKGVARKAQGQMPDIEETLQTLLGKVGLDTSRQGSLGGGTAAGGAGFASPGQAGGSPNFRSPASGQGMQMGQNSGQGQQ
jgi:hypothetical protein